MRSLIWYGFRPKSNIEIQSINSVLIVKPKVLLQKSSQKLIILLYLLQLLTILAIQDLHFSYWWYKSTTKTDFHWSKSFFLALNPQFLSPLCCLPFCFFNLSKKKNALCASCPEGFLWYRNPEEFPISQAKRLAPSWEHYWNLPPPRSNMPDWLVFLFPESLPHKYLLLSPLRCCLHKSPLPSIQSKQRSPKATLST